MSAVSLEEGVRGGKIRESKHGGRTDRGKSQKSERDGAGKGGGMLLPLPLKKGDQALEAGGKRKTINEHWGRKLCCPQGKLELFRRYKKEV